MQSEGMAPFGRTEKRGKMHAGDIIIEDIIIERNINKLHGLITWCYFL